MTKKLGKGLLVALLAMATLGCGDSEEEPERVKADETDLGVNLVSFACRILSSLVPAG